MAFHSVPEATTYTAVCPNLMLASKLCNSSAGSSTRSSSSLTGFDLRQDHILLVRSMEVHSGPTDTNLLKRNARALPTVASGLKPTCHHFVADARQGMRRHYDRHWVVGQERSKEDAGVFRAAGRPSVVDWSGLATDHGLSKTTSPGPIMRTYSPLPAVLSR